MTISLLLFLALSAPLETVHGLATVQEPEIERWEAKRGHVTWYNVTATLFLDSMPPPSGPFYYDSVLWGGDTVCRGRFCPRPLRRQRAGFLVIRRDGATLRGVWYKTGASRRLVCEVSGTVVEPYTDQPGAELPVTLICKGSKKPRSIALIRVQ